MRRKAKDHGKAEQQIEIIPEIPTDSMEPINQKEIIEELKSEVKEEGPPILQTSEEIINSSQTSLEKNFCINDLLNNIESRECALEEDPEVRDLMNLLEDFDSTPSLNK